MDLSKKLILLLVLLCLGISKLTTVEAQNKLREIAESPVVNLIFIFDSLKMSAADVKGYLGNVAESKKGYFIINIFDCEEIEIQNAEQQFPYCSEENRKTLPQLLFTEPLLNYKQEKDKYGARQVPYQGAVEEKKLYQFAQPLIRTYSRVIKSLSDLKSFREENQDTPRVIYFTDKEKLSFYYRALTGNFRHTIAFAHVFSNNTKVCHQLRVNAFPSLLLNQKESLEVNPHLNKQIEYMQEFASDTKLSIVIPVDHNQGEDVVETAEELESKILNVPRYSVIHVTDGKDHPAWKGLKKKLLTGFDYFVADKTMAATLGVKNFPSIVFYHKSLSKKQSMRTNFNERLSLRDIIQQITSLIDDYSISVGSHQQMQRHTSIAFKQNKKIVVLFHDQEVPIGYRLISNSDQYKQKLIFFKYKNPEPEIREQFQIKKKLPVLTVMYVSDEEFDEKEVKEMQEANRGKKEGGVEYRLRIGQFNGVLSYEDIQTYLDSFLVTSNKYNNQGKKEDEDMNEERNLLHVKSMKHLNKYCIKDSCYLLLVDNNPAHSESAKRAADFTKSITKRVYENVVWADGVCHPQLLSLFEIQEDDLPVLVYINHKFQKYSKLIGRLTAESPNTFVSKVKNNKITYRNYNNLAIQDKNCEEMHTKMDALKFAKSELTEEQKQIIEEIKREAEEKRKEAESAGKKKKPKKKPQKKAQEEDSQL